MRGTTFLYQKVKIGIEFWAITTLMRKVDFCSLCRFPPPQGPSEALLGLTGCLGCGWPSPVEFLHNDNIAREKLSCDATSRAENKKRTPRRFLCFLHFQNVTGAARKLYIMDRGGGPGASLGENSDTPDFSSGIQYFR